MKSTTYTIPFVIYWIIAAIDITGVGLGIDWVHRLTKPLIVSFLLLVVLLSNRTYPKRMLIFAALFFSWCGDVLLMFEQKNALFFTAGLGSFLIAHIFYILFFLSIRPIEKSLLKAYPFVPVIIVAYVAALLWLLIPRLGPLKIPVIIYAIVLGSMLLSAIHIFHRTNLQSGRLIICGALFFVVSDSLLATDKFYAPIPHAGMLIMFTYCMAQFLLVKGFLMMKIQTP